MVSLWSIVVNRVSFLFPFWVEALSEDEECFWFDCAFNRGGVCVCVWGEYESENGNVESN